MDSDRDRDIAPTPTLDSLLEPPTESSSYHIPDRFRCCCGNDNCESAHQSSQAVRGLQKDVRTAARLGQALLSRHEAYVADTEAERLETTRAMAKLESKNKELEEVNARFVAENKGLLDQLDGLNTSVTDSEAHVQSLTATLQSTQFELQRLSTFAARTERLEMQLRELETEQARLQHTLATTEEEERVAQQQWRACQRQVHELEAQLESIEKDAKEERDRHAEVVERMERRRAVEKELTTAPSQHDVNGKSHEKRGSEVVSSFVKEILQDNANLQLSMVELRELLSNSNEEVESLRGLLQEYDVLGQRQTNTSLTPNLGAELGADTSTKLSQEFHVHHHYHTPSVSETKEKPAAHARSRRKRQVLASGYTTPSTSISFTPRHRHNPSHSSSHDMRSESPRRQNRWSMQSRSSFAPSTVPSSPPSNPPSTIFERAFGDDAACSSRPTSPESTGLWSPSLKPYHSNRPSEDFQPLSLPTYPGISIRRPNATQADNAILSPVEQTKDTSQSSSRPTLHNLPDIPDRDLTPSPIQEEPETNTPTQPIKIATPANKLRRTASHASLFSISGMDIHSSFPEPQNPPPTLRVVRTRPVLAASASSSSGTVLTAAAATALAAKGKYSARSQLTQGLRGKLGPETIAEEKREDRYAPLVDTFGKRVGGWLSGRWVSSENSTGARKDGESKRKGSSASASSSSVQTLSQTQSSDQKSLVSDSASEVSFKFNKAAGPIQSQSQNASHPGAIRGKRPIEVLMTSALDSEALQESLLEE